MKRQPMIKPMALFPRAWYSIEYCHSCQGAFKITERFLAEGDYLVAGKASKTLIFPCCPHCGVRTAVYIRNWPEAMQQKLRS